jgi:DNA-binding FadR family transcriptional regulator
MNVSSIGAAQNAYATGAAAPGAAATDFKALAQALQSGDLDAARQAFATLQQDSPWVGRALSTSTAIGATSDSPVASALQSLGKALQSGDVGAAQQAFASLQQAAQSSHHAHHHHKQAQGTDATSSTPAPTPATGIDTLA